MTAEAPGTTPSQPTSATERAGAQAEVPSSAAGTGDDATLESLVAAAHTATEARLRELAPAADLAPTRLHDAMRHSLLAPGKRVRPILTVLAHTVASPRRDATRPTMTAVLTSACAIEMVHAASLILDDLPAMDNADLRRGLPTSHAMFGDDTAILAAIGLMNRAFDAVAQDDALGAAQRTAVVAALAESIGSNGLIGGQEEDLHGLDPTLDEEAALARMHRRKTGALFGAACRIGAITANASAERGDALHAFGMQIGHAFQTLDDVLDAAASPTAAGKPTGADGGKTTLVSLHGIERARTAAEEQRDAARACLDLPNDRLLSGYADALVTMLLKRHAG
ncbi:MAG: polyprenyl synthetase family protein [Pseudomonadota bacterium]